MIYGGEPKNLKREVPKTLCQDIKKLQSFRTEFKEKVWHV